MSQLIQVSSHSMKEYEMDLYVGNKEVHLLRYFEPKPGLFIAESKNVIETALTRGYEPYHVVCTKKMLEDPVIAKLDKLPIHVVDEKEANRYFGYVLTGGISCAMHRKSKTDYKEIIKKARRIVVLEDIVNPTNLGAIFRSAAALGIDAVLLSPACVDPLYRRAIRVSVGNVFNVPWAYVGESQAMWKEKGIQLLKEEGFLTTAMALREDNISIDAAILKKADKLAIILGNEGNGLSHTTIEACDYVARIPMMNEVDSLNVAVAAGIAMWEMRNPRNV